MNAVLTAIDEAIAIIDRFIAADSSAPAFAAVIKMMLARIRAAAQALTPDLEELMERREREQLEREKENAYRRKKRRDKPASAGRPSDAETSVGCPADAVSSRARSSSSYLEESKIDDDDDTRARVFKSRSAGEIAGEIELVVKAAGKWPRNPGSYWTRAVVVPQIEGRLTQGMSAELIIGAVQSAAPRSPNTIESFQYFNRPGGAIETVFEATREKQAAELQLPLMRSIVGGKASLNDSYLERRIAASKQTSQAHGDRGATSDQAAADAMDPAETG